MDEILHLLPVIVMFFILVLKLLTVRLELIVLDHLKLFRERYLWYLKNKISMYL